VEDLLPFSDEGLLRAVFAARTPVVSAIGHEPDSPLLDLVADLRASTPTDAAKLVVPDVLEEATRVGQLRQRGRQVLGAWLAREQHALDSVRARPSLADPGNGLEDRRREVLALRERARRTLHHQLDRAGNDLGHQLARVRGMSPLATLERGYAVVQDADGHVVTRADQTAVDRALRVRVAWGRIDTVVTGTIKPSEPSEPSEPEAGPAGPRADRSAAEEENDA
jgi:exodeoxyribonuclease VII large subunit